uniref:NADH-ubiquinone oxidoreductase chain 2 n=1 Tax=Pselaphinae sp. 6 EF-2015 TaxID=1756860 RepID=A0A0S2M8N6_9COLE|nr:NADH deshydrogenase subunit 2 [Pselaphinae sp. 6 EF-2015]
MFFLILLISSMISISANSWMGMWIGLEINLLSIIPLMNSIKNSYSSESSIKYFITQALSSCIMLFSVILMMKMNSLSVNMPNLFSMIFNSAMFTKMGAAPFHFWFPEIMEGLTWMNCLMMLTWQKIAPMVLSAYNYMNLYFITMIIMFSMLISGILGLNQISIRKILTYSSINHIGWMITSFLILETLWIYYFIIYSFSITVLIITLNLYNINNLKQLFTFMNKNLMIYVFIIMNFMSISGLPPFIGFMPKWLTIQIMINNNLIFIVYFMIMTTLISIYFYLRTMFTSLNLSINESMFINQDFNNKFILLTMNFINISLLPICSMIFNFT